MKTAVIHNTRQGSTPLHYTNAKLWRNFPPSLCSSCTRTMDCGKTNSVSGWPAVSVSGAIDVSARDCAPTEKHDNSLLSRSVCPLAVPAQRGVLGDRLLWKGRSIPCKTLDLNLICHFVPHVDTDHSSFPTRIIRTTYAPRLHRHWSGIKEISCQG